ncbi:8411_t:CDS:2 [Gigaspora margarita]|uniref:8411_t:CDS:1 n=1 Tax=Gigaspora margarita TaxID=4874 RepID=A0ABN7W379_GIGMA|nr:8411_t:CDS:2 [Gigaspora margarita]
MLDDNLGLELSASTEKLFSKKVKKTSRKKVSSIIKQLIKELLIDIPDGGRSLQETSKSVSNFLQLFEKIDHAKTKNEEELKPKFGKDGSKAIVKKEIRIVIPETKCSDEAL